MVREPSEVRGLAIASGERGKRAPMQREPAIWRGSVLDRQPDKLVPESDLRPDGSHDPRLQALLQAVDQLASEDLQQPKIDLAGHDGDRIQQSSRWAVQAGRACQYRVADRLGDPCATGREHFGDEERITPVRRCSS
jgi:hypothetical protein